jgi:shikimate kinase
MTGASKIANPNSIIFLVGFMACGKSTVGPVLAARLACPFIDLDRVIEAQEGCTIGELIARAGEEHFRQIETATLRAMALHAAAVIAPGGGAITRAENRALMNQLGTTIWLDAPFALCWQRIQQDGTVRPLAPDEATARARYEQRLPLYQQAALRLIINEQQSPAEIAAMLLDSERC